MKTHVRAPVPVLVCHLRVLCQLPLDHECLDVVDGVHVVDAVLHHTPHRLQALVGTHRRHGVTCSPGSAGSQRTGHQQQLQPRQTVPPLNLSLCKRWRTVSQPARALHTRVSSHKAQPPATLSRLPPRTTVPVLCSRPPPLTLHQYVAVCEQLQRLECAAVGPDQALSPLHELLLVAQHAADLDDVALHVVLQDLQRLQAY